MKEGKKEEAEAAKRQVADIKARSKELEELMKLLEDSSSLSQKELHGQTE